MKIDEFVRMTLLDITKGATEAQELSLLHIAPGTVEGDIVKTPSMVRFEIAVTVSKEGGGGISVWSLGDFKGSASSEQSNRISFEVPVYFQAPTSRNPKHFSSKSEEK